MEEIINYLVALAHARESGEREFTCPICGGTAHWSESQENGHVFSKCDSCDMMVRE